ncbi:hypothetical protein NDU88_003954 [Pleurodeles waltl]|uniref:Uncharacterized protein n=1 Tax=Pleurodeles waltl TaxID=8319 RepID=A0AAV7NKW9_PLEWA|nr:hypothetical protein NDU88_003954 [Pleurodeles waltl]
MYLVLWSQAANREPLLPVGAALTELWQRVAGATVACRCTISFVPSGWAVPRLAESCRSATVTVIGELVCRLLACWPAGDLEDRLARSDWMLPGCLAGSLRVTAI